MALPLGDNPPASTWLTTDALLEALDHPHLYWVAVLCKPNREKALAHWLLPEGDPTQSRTHAGNPVYYFLPMTTTRSQSSRNLIYRPTLPGYLFAASYQTPLFARSAATRSGYALNTVIPSALSQPHFRREIALFAHADNEDRNITAQPAVTRLSSRKPGDLMRVRTGSMQGVTGMYISDDTSSSNSNGSGSGRLLVNLPVMGATVAMSFDLDELEFAPDHHTAKLEATAP